MYFQKISAAAMAGAMLFAVTAPVHAGGYVLGAGRWPCSKVAQVADSGTKSEVGQLAGWLMGFWSAATFEREEGFIDTVEKAGGRAILEGSVAECRNAPADTLLYAVAQSMIRNTK